MWFCFFFYCSPKSSKILVLILISFSLFREGEGISFVCLVEGQGYLVSVPEESLRMEYE